MITDTRHVTAAKHISGPRRPLEDRWRAANFGEDVIMSPSTLTRRTVPFTSRVPDSRSTSAHRRLRAQGSLITAISGR